MNYWQAITDNITGRYQPIYLFDPAGIRIEGFDFSPIQESAVVSDLVSYMAAFSGDNFDPDLEAVGIESWFTEDPNET